MAPEAFWTPLLRALGLDKSGKSPRNKEMDRLIADLKDSMPDRRDVYKRQGGRVCLGPLARPFEFSERGGRIEPAVRALLG